ncbi:helix-turn-helix domain-containing protein [Sphingobacterium thalpophilum]|uniref:helix-turn-helix domain-containing protein n=1 Tax=Sphingobacterium thalpophilum TaxID=259 RepID=UPI0037DA4581
MKKNTNFKLDGLFEKFTECLPPLEPQIHLASVQPTAYGSERGHVLQQSFDGLVGFINCFDFDLQTSTVIPVEISGNDLHMLYFLDGTRPITLCDKGSGSTYRLNPHRGCFLYLPKGDYALHVPPGRSCIFNFYFRGSIFRDGNERPFSHLHELISDFRQGSDRSRSSIDFKVGDRTRLLIKTIMTNIKKGDLDSEDNILWGIKKLIKLSKEKVFDEYEKISASQLKAKAAHELIRHTVSVYGQDFKLDDIVAQLGISMDYLHEVIQQYYGESPQEMKQTLVLDLAKKYVIDGLQTDQIAYELGYSSPSSFCRFFKREAGMTVTEFFRRHSQ